MLNQKIEVLDFGFVRLDGLMADDLSVINSARVSFGAHKEQFDESDIGLINFLMRERHGTPFEHNAFRFHVRCPIFVAREWFRHRIGSFNELSGRYKEIPTDGYLPALEDYRTQVGKPGAYRFEQIPMDDALVIMDEISTLYEAAYATYDGLLAKGLAKELARLVLPVGTYTEFYWTVNARSLMNFLSLRSASTAQYEIQEYSNALISIFEFAMPHTAEAWKNNNRIAP